MLQAPKLVGEESRLQVLRDLEILDTAPEAAYDEIVQLAALACHTMRPCCLSLTINASGLSQVFA